MDAEVFFCSPASDADECGSAATFDSASCESLGYEECSPPDGNLIDFHISYNCPANQWQIHGATLNTMNGTHSQDYADATFELIDPAVPQRGATLKFRFSGIPASPGSIDIRNQAQDAWCRGALENPELEVRFEVPAFR